MKILIIGGGVAALESAIAARRVLPEAAIHIYSREAVLPYRRPALTRMPGEDLPDHQFLIKQRDFYDNAKIEISLKSEVVAVDRAKHTVTLGDGSVDTYDKLVIATGADAFRIPITGSDLPHVGVLREFADVEKLRQAIAGGGKRVVIIGCGVLGLELAESLIKVGCPVTMVESCPYLLPRNLDMTGAEIAYDQLKSVPNLSMAFGRTVQEITPGSVVLEDETIPADLVVFSAGSRPNIALAKAAGLNCNRGIMVDEHLATSDPDIYAAGDCMEFHGVCFGLYPQAKNAGAIAGANAAGENNTYQIETAPVRLNAFQLKVFSSGAIDSDDVMQSRQNNNYEKLFYRDNKLTGMILIGDLSKALKLKIGDKKDAQN